MEQVFLTILNMSLTASWLVLCVIVLRFALKKAPKALRCILWGLVALRLLFPFSVESVLSLIPSAEPIPQDIIYSAEPVINSGVPIVNEIINPVIRAQLAPTVSDSINPMQILTAGAAVIWIAGMLAMFIYGIISYWLVRRTVDASMPLGDRVYLCDGIPSPFILGIFRPRIYLPSQIDGVQVQYVLAHENAHLKRRDHWWKPLGFVLLSVYWFNPLFWVAYSMLCRDIELACDERVVKTMSAEGKKAYSEALLSCSMPRRRLQACPLAFGEVGVKARVKSVLSYKKPTFWLILLAVAACVAASVFFMTDPVTDDTYGPITAIEDIDVSACFDGVNELNVYSSENTVESLSGAKDAEAIENVLYVLKQIRVTREPIEIEDERESTWIYRIVLSESDPEKLLRLRFDETCTVMEVYRGTGRSFTYGVQNADYVRAMFDMMNGRELQTEASSISGIRAEVQYVDTILPETYLDLVWTNDRDEDLSYSTAFDIQRYEDGEWTSCAKGTPTFTEIAHVLPARSSVTQRYSLSAFDISQPGTYRIYIAHGVNDYFYDTFTAPYLEGSRQTIETYHGILSYIYTDAGRDQAELILDTNTKQFSFSYSQLADRLLSGRFAATETALTLTTNEGEVYVFDIVDNGVAFNAERSAELPRYRYAEDEEARVCVPDGALFLQSVDRSFAVSTAWAGYSEDSQLNHATWVAHPIQYKNAQHLPVYRIQSVWGLESLKERFKYVASFAESHGDIPSFDEATQAFDIDYFRSNALLVVYVPTESASLRYGVTKVDRAHVAGLDMATIHVETLNEPEAGDTEKGGYWLIVEVSKEFLTAEDSAEDAVLDVYVPKTATGEETAAQYVRRYQDAIEGLFEQEYGDRLDRQHTTVAKLMSGWRNNERRQDEYRYDPDTVLSELRQQLNALLPFRSKGSLIGPVAPATYAEAKEYVLDEYDYFMNRVTGKSIEQFVERMETEDGGQSPSDYAEDPQAHFDWARARIWNEHVRNYEMYLYITRD